MFGLSLIFFSVSWLSIRAWYVHIPDGDVKLAGIYNVHMKGNLGKGYWQKCGVIDPQYGIMFIEAMLFALDRINSDATILKGLKLRARIYDTCGDKRYLRDALARVANYASQGVVGPQYSDDAITTAIVMNIFGKNTISYAATSPDLENRIRYSYFYRTVPSDYNAVKLLLSLALRFEWQYIALVSSEGNYGQRSSDLFRDSFEAQGICIPVEVTVSEEATNAEYEYTIRRIREKDSVKVVFLLMTDHHLVRFFEVAEKLKNETADLQFVASDGWGSRSFIAPGRTVANGTITFQIQTNEVPEFRDYFLKLNPRTNTRNIWFKPFWEQTFNCSFTKALKKKCSGYEQLNEGQGYFSQTPVLSVINAVYAYAYAFQNVIIAECLLQNKTVHNCSKVDGMLQGLKSYRYVLYYVARAMFKEPFRDKIFKFSKAGDYDQNYEILNFHIPISGSKGVYKVIGSWNNIDNKTLAFKNNVIKNLPLQPETWRLQLNASNITWKTGTVPVSVCSLPCKAGHVRQSTTSCCWVCIQCGENDFIENNTCKLCHPSSVPDPLYQYCRALPVKYIGAHNDISLTILCFSIFGILLTASVCGLFWKNFDRRIVKASSRELCMLLLFGIGVVYASPTAFILKPSSLVCNIQRVIVGIGLTACYAPLLLRTNRIYRIFKSAQTTVSRPSMISPRSQIIMSLGTTGIGVLIGLVSILGRTSKINTAYPRHRQYIVEYCELTEQTVIVNLSFSSALMIATTCYAFQTRNFPKNYNEAKYIGFTMYVTCLVLAVSLPLFFFINGEEGKSRALVLCSLCVINASINLIGLFGNKVKLLLSKNVVELDNNVTTIANATNIKANVQRIQVTFDLKDMDETIMNTEQGADPPAESGEEPPTGREEDLPYV